MFGNALRFGIPHLECETHCINLVVMFISFSSPTIFEKMSDYRRVSHVNGNGKGNDTWIIILAICAIPVLYVLWRILSWVKSLFRKDKEKWMKEGRDEAIEMAERLMRAWDRDGRVGSGYGYERALDRLIDARGVVMRVRHDDEVSGVGVGMVMQWILGVWLGLGLFWGSNVRWPQFWALCWGFGFGLIFPSLVTWKEWKRLKWFVGLGFALNQSSLLSVGHTIIIPRRLIAPSSQLDRRLEVAHHDRRLHRN